jgi:hypothetical protein
MQPRVIGEILDRFLIHGFANNIFEAIQPHKITHSRAITGIGPENRLGMITNGGISLQEYMKILDDGTYSAVSVDGSVLYIECDFMNNSLYNHRYFYIPCPFDAELVYKKPSHFQLADWLRDSIDLEGADVFRSRGAFRFDCSRELSAEAQDTHPVSHITFASGDCRMPVRGPMQISAFLHLVFDNFLRDFRPIWLNFAPYMKLDDTEITIRDRETLGHYVNWDPH